MFSCQHYGCTKAYTKQCRLEEHERIHTGERPFVCEVDGCDKSYYRASHLERHRVQVHAESHPFMCEIDGCNSRYGDAHSLNRHIKSHGVAKIYTCTICSCVFTKHSALRSHMALHTHVKPFSCTVKDCGKSFLTRAKLMRHDKTHNFGYICTKDDCTASFCKWSDLLKHTKAAHPTVYQCDFCDKTFKQKKVLKEHLKTHNTDRQEHLCMYPDCGRSYVSSSSLKQHVKSAHSIKKQFVCEVAGCSRQFAWKASLQRHVQKVHKLKGPSPDEQRLKASQSGNMSKIRDGLTIAGAGVSSVGYDSAAGGSTTCVKRLEEKATISLGSDVPAQPRIATNNAHIVSEAEVQRQKDFDAVRAILSVNT